MKFRNILIVSITLTISLLTQAQQYASGQRFAVKINTQSNWWCGVINHGSMMPLKAGYEADMYGNNYGNQIQPLLLSNQGEVVWCEQPISIKYTADSLIVESKTEKVNYTKAGTTLKQAYQFATKNYFPYSGKIPDKLLFSNPQYNTWIELMYDQNEVDIMKYAQAIVDNGLTPGVLMIDDNWQEDYGTWTFHPGRFKSPKEMIAKLHKMGFKVMVWVCPFVSADSKNGREVAKTKIVFLNKNNDPAVCRWWNGYSLLLDFSNPKAVDWFKNSLNVLVSEYGVDGFKFDAGDIGKDESNLISFRKFTSPNEYTELYAKIGLDFPLNEYRANWKMGGQAIANRLADKGHNWNDLHELIPNMIQEGLMGYAYSCPDMIGGGEFTSFLNASKIDQDLIVRSAQCHALMPMMQFSVAPWRILDKPHFDAVLKAVKLREKFTGYILRTVENTAKTGEPVLRPLEYDYPNSGYEKVKDQFLIGDSLLVAPILEQNVTKRTIMLPKGNWKEESGKIFKGPQALEVNADINVLPYLFLTK
jgi:alpha-glucosidase